ncbi:MAG: hypothetical protein ABIM21_03915 [candidate division WOR-3 bacterium]
MPYIYWLLLSWYSFFGVDAFGGYHKKSFLYNSNPALISKFENSVLVSGKFWDNETKIAELNIFKSSFNFNFTFYNFGLFSYSSTIPDDFSNLQYAAFAYKLALGYVIPFDSTFFFGIKAQYNRFEYHNFFAEGFTINLGSLYTFPKVPVSLQIFLKDFGISSSEGYSFPSSLNIGAGYIFKNKLFFDLLLSQNISEGLNYVLKHDYYLSLSSAYAFRESIRSGVSFYAGDDLRISTIFLKFKPRNRMAIFYTITLRKEGFGPIQSLTLGVE